MPHRLTGQRVDDPPPEKQRLLYRARLAAHKYPVQVALAIALLLVLIPVSMLLNSNGSLRKSNAALRRSDAALRNNAVRTQINRRATLDTFCKVINTNAATANTQTDYIKALILGGVRSSRSFEHVFRQLGLPPYRVRLRQARKQASGLERLKLPPLDCVALRHQADAQIRDLLKGTGGNIFIYDGTEYDGRT